MATAAHPHNASLPVALGLSSPRLVVPRSSFWTKKHRAGATLAGESDSAGRVCTPFAAHPQRLALALLRLLPPAAQVAA